MQKRRLNIMAVDDDEVNLEILLKNIRDYGYSAAGFVDGKEAWERLSSNPDEFDIVLLDKMMPRMNGLEVLSKIRRHEVLKNVPVIMQTGDVDKESIREGLDSGALYYLCKPFDPNTMLAQINAVARDVIEKNTSLKYMRKETALTNFIASALFKIRTHDDAKRLAAAIAYSAKDPESINTALIELMANAVEHGNLGIKYEQKSSLLVSNKFKEEVDRRLALPENKDKFVFVEMINHESDNANEIVITDQGNGFNWKEYTEFDPLRLTDPNGRGVPTVFLMKIGVRYNEIGNQVRCVFEKSANVPELIEDEV